MEGKLANHIYNVDEKKAQELVTHGCFKKKNSDGTYDVRMGTGDYAVYYSKDRDDLDGTLAPTLKIPDQLKNCRILRVGDEKAPIDYEWQKTGGANYSITDPNTQWAIVHEKYGVLCGVDGLIVIDFDDETTQKEILESGILPETFTVKTARKGLYHLYFYTDDPFAEKIMTKDKETLADIQGRVKQVIGPGSRIPDGRTYDIVKDIPIATVPSALIKRALYRFDYKKSTEILDQVKNELTLDDFNIPRGNDNAVKEIKQQLKIRDLLNDRGISTSRNLTKCPFHDSKGGKCLGFNDETWHCFHCEEKGDAITLWMMLNNVTDFVEAKKQLCEKFNIKDTYVAEKKKEAAVINNGRPMQRLPNKNYTQEQFAADISQYFKGDERVFFKPDEDTIVEIKKFEDKLLKREIVGFRVVDPKRLLNIVEKKVNTYNIEYVKKEEVQVRQSPNEQTIKLLSANEDFLGALYNIKRFLSYPIPFIDHNGDLIIPRHQPGKGYYDDRFQAYFTSECPELKLMTVSEAKYLLNDILNEFCFKEDRDKIMALAYIITPMCRGLYKRPTARTPIFIISANRERAGKDYLAGIRGILYEGQAIDDTPIVTGEKNESNNDELRKKLTAALKTGRRLFHSSNNRGFLNNATLEQFSTSEVWRDRELGRNTQLELSNEVDISLSANVGLTFTADLHHRSRPINLFYSEENPNERAYKRVDLHGHVLTNRAILLSAIYTLINAWFTAGKPPGKTLFTSFPEWARVVGGIMTYHNLGDPCVSIEDTNIGGDAETKSMKEFASFMGLHQMGDATQPLGYKISDLRRIVIEAHSSEEMEGFASWDFTDKGVQTKFGNLVKRFVGREFHSKQTTKNGVTHFKVRIIIAKENDRSNQILYGFPIEVEKDKVIDTQKELPSAIKEESVEELMPKIKTEELTYAEAKRKLLSILATGGEVYTGSLVERGISDEQIIAFINEGTIYEVKPGYVGLLK